jgi:hypothetical protein
MLQTKKTTPRRATASATAPKTVAAVNAKQVADDRYEDFLAAAQRHFAALIATSPRLFTTDAEGLWEEYLRQAPGGARQSRTCNCCRHFIQRFGSLVTISETGEMESAIWPKDAPPAYRDAAYSLRNIIKRSNVTGVFRSNAKVWGTPRTGEWTHIALTAPANILSTSVVTTPNQEMAAKVEEYGMLERSLAEFSVDVVRQAVAILSTESLYRSEKVLGVAKWLLDLHESLAATKNKQARANLKWLAVAKAPPGYCHVRSGMIGTLLEDLAAGLPFETVKRKFGEKMNPLQYMRPQAPPSDGNIAQAEKIVAALRSAGALERRFAKLSDIQCIWLPKEPEAKAAKGGVFGHLTGRKQTTPVASGAPPQVMTWVKFRDTVLPGAEAIEFLVPSDHRPYTAMVTSVNPDAPNLLQWDNPVSHYVYAQGSLPRQWNLVAGRYHRVTAVSLRSWMWGERSYDHHGAGVVFVLDGARDLEHRVSGGMFPEQMKSEYHPVRRTLEAHFKSAPIAGRDEASACGIAITKGQDAGLTFRVTARGVMMDYRIDRWD